MLDFRYPDTRTVRDIEDNQGNIESVSSKTQILGQAIDFRIANIAPVDESEEPAIFIRTA
jgi:hypothetical protein